MSSTAPLRRQFRLAHQLLEAAADRLAPTITHWAPPGLANPAGASYAQVVLAEDLSINGVLTARPPLALSSWVGRTGVSELPPFAALATWHAWARRVRVDFPALRYYARAVYASTDAYLATLPGAALGSPAADCAASVLEALLLTVAMRRGEIACLLAIQTPFSSGDTFRAAPQDTRFEGDRSSR